MKRLREMLLILMLAIFFCAGCGGKNETDAETGKNGEGAEEVSAVTMRLEKTKGSVGIMDGDKKEVETKEKLPLYDGYQAQTRIDSYAWINLDDTKLAKMDELSTAEISKEEEHLTMTAAEGGLFFHVTEPLKEEESLEIHTGTMVVGIRGTCGWVNATGEKSPNVYIIEGTVTCELTDTGESTEVSAGEMARVVSGADGKTSLEVKPFSREDIPEYVMEELDDGLLSGVPEEPADPEGEYTLPLSEEELGEIMREAINKRDGTITIHPGEGENVLTLNGFITIYGTLVLDEGVSLSVTEDAQINIDGTLEVRSDIVNDGFIVLMEDGTLKVDGVFTNNKTLFNGDIGKGGMEDEPEETQNSRIIAAQPIETSGTFMSVGYIEGTVVQNDESGVITLSAGNIDHIILNAGLLIEDGGTYGELTQNGGNITSAAQGYMW